MTSLYRVKAQEITTHTFMIEAADKDDAEYIAYKVIRGSASNEEMDAVMDENIEMTDHFTSRKVKSPRRERNEREESEC